MENEIESRVARRKRLEEASNKATKNTSLSIGSKVYRAIFAIMLAVALFITGWYGYTKFVIEPRLDSMTTQSTQELKQEFANSIQGTDIVNKGSEATKGNTDKASSPKAITDPAKTPVPERVGTYEKFGIFYSPKLGDKYSAVITAGDDSSEISGPMAVDYYPETAMPGQIGNYLLAGHVGYSGMARFETLHTLEAGDDVYTETKEGWYRYTVTGKDVVEPEDIEVLAPVPNKPGVKPTKAVMTMTTCFFENNIKNRLVVWADYQDFTPRSAGKPEAIKNA